MESLEYVIGVIEPWLDKYFEVGVASLSELEAVGVGVWLLDAQVNNGGFDQYYFNTGGVLATQTVHGLRAIFAYNTAAMLESANSLMPFLPLPDDRDLRSAILDEVNARTSTLRALDTEYYRESEDRIQLLAEYLISKSQSGI